MGKTIADGYIELRVDDSKLTPDAKAKATKVSREFGTRLNRELKALNLDAIDLTADPTSARATIRDTERRLKDLSAGAGTLDLQIRSNQALAAVGRLRKQIGDLDDQPVVVDADTAPAGREVDRLSRQLIALGLEPVDLDADPTEALAAIDRVQDQLRRLGSDTVTARVRLDIDTAMADTGRLRSRLAGSLANGGVEAAAEFAGQFGGKLAPLLEKLPLGASMGTAASAAAAPAAAAAAAVIGSVIGAAVSGAIIGGVGIGGVVGGLMIAAKDSRVQAAADDLFGRFEARAARAAGVFLDPTLEAVHRLDDALNQLNIEDVFRDASRYVLPLTQGVSSAMIDLGDGIEDLVANAGPPIIAISEGIAGIGEHLGDGLSSLADNGEDAASALQLMFSIINTAIDTVFMMVNGLTELYGWLDRIGTFDGFRFLQHAMGDIGGPIKDTTTKTAGLGQALDLAGDKAEDLKKQAELLKPAQDAVKQSQDALARTLSDLGGKNTTAARSAEALKTAMDNLYGAAIRQTDANESYEASWDGLSESVKNNKATLDIHTRAGRSNRDALQALLTSSNELYLADINAGVSIAEATKKHQARTTAVKEEARRVGLNKTATDDLIGTYGRIPGKKTTDLVLDGVTKVANTLHDLYVFQRALAEGVPIATMEALLKNEKPPSRSKGAFSGYATGGLYDGLIPGRPSAVDNVLATTAGGKKIALATGEFIVNAAQTAKNRDLLEAINAGFDGFAAGGLFGRVDTSRSWPFAIDVAGTKLLSKSAAAAKVIPAVPAGGHTSDWIVRVVHAAFPGLAVYSKDRPGSRTLTGNVSYHALGRAVDFPPSRALAEWINQHYKGRTKELITPYQDLNIHNGARHTYTGAVWNQHNFAGGNAHDHWALARGGVVGRRARIPLFDAGGTLMPGINTVYNGTGRPEPLVPAGGNTYHLTVQVSTGAHPAEVGREIVNYIKAFEASNTSNWRQRPSS